MRNTAQEIKDKINYMAFYAKECSSIIQSGQDWFRSKTVCPFHNDKHAGSLHVNVKNGAYHCFACGAKGDVFDFVMKKYNIDFKQALQRLESEV